MEMVEITFLSSFHTFISIIFMYYIVDKKNIFALCMHLWNIIKIYEYIYDEVSFMYSIRTNASVEVE